MGYAGARETLPELLVNAGGVAREKYVDELFRRAIHAA